MIHSRSNHLQRVAWHLKRIARKQRKDGTHLPLDARCTLHSIKHYCETRQEIWKSVKR